MRKEKRSIWLVGIMWTRECQEAFEKLKEYLETPPLLDSPKEGEPLFVYLAASDEVVASALVREEAGHHKPIYYVSRALQAWELNMEKLAYAFVVAARKLRQYLKSHLVTVLTDFPLKEVLQKIDASVSMVRWSVRRAQ